MVVDALKSTSEQAGGAVTVVLNARLTLRITGLGKGWKTVGGKWGTVRGLARARTKLSVLFRSSTVSLGGRGG